MVADFFKKWGVFKIANIWQPSYLFQYWMYYDQILRCMSTMFTTGRIRNLFKTWRLFPFMENIQKSESMINNNLWCRHWHWQEVCWWMGGHGGCIPIDFPLSIRFFSTYSPNWTSLTWRRMMSREVSASVVTMILLMMLGYFKIPSIGPLG